MKCLVNKHMELVRPPAACGPREPTPSKRRNGPRPGRLHVEYLKMYPFELW